MQKLFEIVIKKIIIKQTIDRNADRLDYDPQDQAEIDFERMQEIKKELSKVCSAYDLDEFKEWIEEETNFQLYYTRDWLETNTGKLFTIEQVYKKFLAKDLKAV